MDIFDRIRNERGPLGQHARESHGYFTFPKLEGEISNKMTFRGKEVLVWSINNYLGLSNHPEVRKVVQNTIDRITKAGKVAGTVASLNSYEWAMQRGARFFLSGAIDWVQQGFNEFNQLVEKIDK